VVGNTIPGYDFTLAFNGHLGGYCVCHPEPSTYAAIFGVGALGFVILRRRRLAACHS